MTKKQLEYFKNKYKADLVKLIKNNHWITKDLLAFMRKNGFKKINDKFAWINKNEGIVIKCMYKCGKKPKKSIITLPLYKRSWCIQPLAITAGKKVDKIYDKIVNNGSWENCSIWGEDFHRGNVGLYEGEPVVFDW